MHLVFYGGDGYDFKGVTQAGNQALFELEWKRPVLVVRINTRFISLYTNCI